MDSTTAKKLPQMSLNDARSVIWPFRDLKGQAIGPLFDKGLLSLQDLGFAIRQAYDWRVREAARTVLLHALTQESPESENAPGPLNVVAVERRSFSERRQLIIAYLEGIILGGVSVPLLIFSIWYFIHDMTSNRERSFDIPLSTPRDIIVLIIAMLILVLGIAAPYIFFKLLERLVLDRLDEKLKLYRKGQLGEDCVLNVMYSVLDGRWWLFPNMELPGRRLGDLDFVLVGPHGMWSFEVKAYTGEYRNTGEHWEKCYGGKWHTVRKSPTRQARRNAAELGQLLSTNGIKQWVNSVVIWANPESTVSLSNPSCDVWMLDQLSQHLKALSDERPIPQTQIAQIVEVLKKIHQDDEDI
ncbi:MAG TPA: nuclease-related domain-containing protein [Aggregatilineaceae bacterium]|nr:nuclease-related domain-containing protein [Aggregatilineaceae bacterium]